MDTFLEITIMLQKKTKSRNQRQIVINEYVYERLKSWVDSTNLNDN